MQVIYGRMHAGILMVQCELVGRRGGTMGSSSDWH